MKIRIRFSKDGEMRYIGHLDIMRYFQKAFRRTGFDMVFTQGFHPHHILSFASPLGLGLTSEGEYMDVEMNSSAGSQEMIDALNAQMAEGIRILSFKRLPDDVKTNAMASLKAARYQVTLSGDILEEWESADPSASLDRYLAQEHIILTYDTKRSTVEMDIRPMIYELTYSGGTFGIFAASGSSANLRPEVLLDSLFAASGMTQTASGAFREGTLQIRRIDMYTESDGRLISLDEVGEDL